jgi:hypothetical protein
MAMTPSVVEKLRIFALTTFAVLAAGAPASAAPMSFGLVTVGLGHCRGHCPQVISAQGEIDNGSADAFLDFVRRNVGGGDLHGVVLLDSPGGHVLAAMELGATIRSLGMAVIVARPGGDGRKPAALYSGRCYSACVYALMGGRKRVIPPQSRVGVHRMYNYTTSFNLFEGGFVQERYVDDGDMRQRLAQYSRMMGVSDGLIDLAERISPDYLRVLTPGEIARWRLASQKL